MKRFAATLGIVVVFSLDCATVPIEEHECYESTIDYLQGRKKGYCNDELAEFSLFRKEKPITASNNTVEVIYEGEFGGLGYCLTPSYFGRARIRTYCTLGSGSLDACIFDDLVDGKPRKVTELRAENPRGCNGQPWNVLETVFERTKIDFVEGRSSDLGYREAVSRINDEQ